MKRYLKRTVAAFSKIKLESCMNTIQLSRMKINGKNMSEILMVPSYLPVLTFQLVTRDGRWEDKQIRVTDRSIKRFTLALRRAVEWFYDEDKKDLFYRDDENRLAFNHAYKELHEIYYDPFNQNVFLRIIPAAVEKGGEIYEGVNLYINQIDTLVSITRIDLEDFLGIIVDFSFQEEALILMIAYMIAKNEPDGIIDSDFYIKQQEMDRNLRAVPITSPPIRKNPFGI